MVDRIPKITVPRLQAMKQQKQKIAVLTCYDYSMAQVLNMAELDVLLVGDSLGMVKLGYTSTLPVTVDDMLYHTRMVAKGNSRALLVTDMPYLSYHVSTKQAVENCGKMLKAGAEAVKIEGGAEMAPTFQALHRAKIPVMGHIGMTPQSIHLFGGFKVQARERVTLKKLIADAKALERAGAFSIVLECVPESAAKAVTRVISIPTIGIGAGKECDGQVLVIDDLIGWTPDPHPRFVKRYAEMRQLVQRAAAQFTRDVRAGKFPDSEHSYH